MDEALLTLSQLSPAFPMGGFAYSHGMEWAHAADDFATAADVEDWVADVGATAPARERMPRR